VSRLPTHRALAVALMWSGIATASIRGIRAGTALGQAFGLRATFTAIGCAAMLAVLRCLPRASRSWLSMRQGARKIGKSIGPSIGTAALTRGFGYADLHFIASATTVPGAGAALRCAAPQNPFRNTRETENVDS
jgi:predicted MFS family arabinose efflux permease